MLGMAELAVGNHYSGEVGGNLDARWWEWEWSWACWESPVDSY